MRTGIPAGLKELGSMQRRSTLRILGISCLALSACGGSVDDGTRVNLPPTVSIAPTILDQLVIENREVTLEGTATDAEDGNLSPSIGWSSSLDGAVGSGATLVTNLSGGTHTITATVRDYDGASTQASVALAVLAAPETVTAMSVEAVSESAVSVTWTEVSDGTGAVPSYQVAFRPAGGTRTVAAQGSCADPVVGFEVGGSISCTVEGLQLGTSYGFEVIASRTLSDMTRVFGDPSSEEVTYTDFVEDFTRFSDGDVPAAPHAGLEYVAFDGAQDITTRVADAFGLLTDRPLVLAKTTKSVGAPDFAIQRPDGSPLVDASSGTFQMILEVLAGSDATCHLLAVRSRSSPETVWMSIFGGIGTDQFEPGVLYEIVLTLDLDAKLMTATRNGVAFDLSTRDNDSNVVVAPSAEFPSLPHLFAFEGCTTEVQQIGIDNLRFELRPSP